MGVNGDGDNAVSVLTGQRDGDTWDAETVANSALIAAAPAMKEALRAALEFTNRFGHPNGCTYMKSDHINDCDCGYAYDQIEAALAAAEGK